MVRQPRNQFPRPTGNSVRSSRSENLDEPIVKRNSQLLARQGFAVASLTLAFLLAGCVGVPTPEEKRARRDQQAIEHVYRPGGIHPALPKLGTNSPLGDFLLFAMLNQPQVEAAYFDWAASVERITQMRSRPDPRLTFSTDIANVLMGFMPGLMVDIPGPGKLRAGAGVASAESTVKYFGFEKAALQAAFNLKKAYYQLFFLDAKIEVNRRTLALLSDLERLARSQNEVGKATLQDVLRAQIEQDRLGTEIENLQDSRHTLSAQFKAALGLQAGDAPPPLPAKFETTSLDLSAENMVSIALDRSPRLKAMAAEVRQAEAAIALARKARVPDFSVGIDVNPFASPTVFTPQAGITLPIWRDKIAAQIAEAQANKRAVEARFSAEQIMLAVDFAEKSFMYRENTRTLSLLRERLLPKARQSIEIARAAYLSGQLDFLNLIDAERTLLGFQLGEVEAGTQRELVLAELSLLIIGESPANAPILGTAPRPNRGDHR